MLIDNISTQFWVRSKDFAEDLCHRLPPDLNLETLHAAFQVGRENKDRPITVRGFRAVLRDSKSSYTRRGTGPSLRPRAAAARH